MARRWNGWKVVEMNWRNEPPCISNMGIISGFEEDRDSSEGTNCH